MEQSTTKGIGVCYAKETAVVIGSGAKSNYELHFTSWHIPSKSSS